MNYFFPILLLFGVLTACTAEVEDKPEKEESEEYFEGIATTFEGKKFENTIFNDLLEELGVCEFESSDSTYYATCSPENFKISKFKNEGGLKDAFILEMKAGIFPKNAEVPLPPVRHVIIFEREGGKLVRVGGFRGNLIGKRPNAKSGADDLLLALYDTDDETLFHCVFKWNGGKYEFHSIERLDYGEGFRTIKGEDKLETTQQIFQQLRDKSLIF
ncbi:MAG: hypothetical protein P8P74_14325 [Crocinitomicaceae bacterium]|nr:hypothetical protein [Crocinitomicaceae bacterium]